MENDSGRQVIQTGKTYKIKIERLFENVVYICRVLIKSPALSAVITA